MVNLQEVLAKVYELYPQKGQIVKSLNVMYQDISLIFKDYAVVDWSNIEEYPCYEFVTLLHKNQPILDDDTELMIQLNGLRTDLFLYISSVSDYYCYYIRETNYFEENKEWSFKKVLMGPDTETEIGNLLHQLNDYLESKG